jgi:hypothetical protein
MSALAPIADVADGGNHVSFVPIGDISAAIRSPRRRAREVLVGW